MTTCRDIANHIESIAPLSLAESFDNVGLIAGSYDKPVRTVTVTLDLTAESLRFAVARSSDMIICHHPPIFNKISRITDETPMGSLLLETIKRDIPVYAAHTNFDACPIGTTAALAFQLLGLETEEVLIGGKSFARKAILAEGTTLRLLAEQVKDILCLKSISIAGKAATIVNTAGIIAGDGLDFYPEMISAGCDVFLTGDLKYHKVQEGLASGLSFIDIPHDISEQPGMESLAAELRSDFPDISFEAFCAHPLFGIIETR